MNQKEQLHSIQQLSTKLNIPKPSLRFWEKEFEGVDLLAEIVTEVVRSFERGEG